VDDFGLENHDVIIDILLKQGNDAPLESNYLEDNVVNEDFDLFVISPPDSVCDNANSMTKINFYFGNFIDYSSYALLIPEVDPSKHFLKLNQMNKMIYRSRFINFKFGRLLDTYFECSTRKFDSFTQKRQGFISDY